MDKKFVCKNCGKEFTADDSQRVECPHCKSDNVDYAKFRLPKWVKIGIPAALVAAGATALIAVGVKGCINNANDVNIEDVEENDSLEEQIPEEIMEEVKNLGITIPVSVEARNKPVFSEEDGTYSITLKIKNAPESGGYHFEIRELFGGKVVATSETPELTNIPPTDEDGGTYYAMVVSNAGNEVLAEKEVPGFIKQKKVNKRMSKAEFQALIDKKDDSLLGMGGNDYLAPEYKLSFTGTSETEGVKLISDVFMRINLEMWESVKVSDLGYDDMNRINKITFAVKEADY